MDGPDNDPNAQFQLMERAQIPLDGPYGQPPLFPQGHDQAHQIGSQALTAHDQTFQRVLGQPPFPAQGTGPGYEDMFCNFGGSRRKFDDLPGPLHPSPAQGGMAFGAKLWSVGHLRCGFFHPQTGKAVGTLPARLLFFPCRLLAPGGRLMARHPSSRSAAGQPDFQALDLLAQSGDDALLLRDNLQQSFPARLVQVHCCFHSSLMPQLRPGRQRFSDRRRLSVNSPHQV